MRAFEKEMQVLAIQERTKLQGIEKRIRLLNGLIRVAGGNKREQLIAIRKKLEETLNQLKGRKARPPSLLPFIEKVKE